MKSYAKSLVLAFGIVCASLAFGQDETATTATKAPPKYLNMIHRELKPGRISPYEEAETSIARTYGRENIPVFWVELESMTGPTEALFLSFYESSEDLASSIAASQAGLAAHPELSQMQDHLLQDNIANGTTVLAVRRDDMGYRANMIDFGKTHMLRVETVFAHPGYERAFMEEEWALSEASQKASAHSSWAVYEVTGGLPQPAFIVVTPLQSASELDDLIETERKLKTSDGGALQQRLQELTRIAYGTSDSRLFLVSPKLSHVSKQFTEADPNFWSPSAAVAPPGSRGATGRTGVAVPAKP